MTQSDRRESRILVVDDEPRSVEMMARALRKLGRVETMPSAAEALAAARSAHYNLVISDQRMPGMTGVEMLTYLARESPYTGRVLLTGFADLQETRAAINDANVHAHLSKPCPPDQLRGVASNVIERVRLSERNAELVLQLQERTEELEVVVSSLRKESLVRQQRVTATAVAEIVELTGAALARLDSCLAHLGDRSGNQRHKVRAAQLIVGLRDSLERFTER